MTAPVLLAIVLVVVLAYAPIVLSGLVAKRRERRHDVDAELPDEDLLAELTQGLAR